MRVWRRSAVLAGALLWSAAGAFAQGAEESSDAEARALFNAGQVAFEDARFQDALGYFQRAHELSRRPAMLFNIASAAERVRDDKLALSSYRAYLEALPDASNRRFVEGRMRFLEAALTRDRGGEAEARDEGAIRVPTPAEAARQAPQDGSAPQHADGLEDAGGGSVLGKWWLWTAVGAVVAGIVTGVVLATRNGDGTQEPLPGDVGTGGVVVTLGGGR